VSYVGYQQQELTVGDNRNLAITLAPSNAQVSEVVVTALGIRSKYLERSGIDALVNGVGRLVNYGGRQMRWLQSGQVGSYVLLMVISMLLFFVLQFFLRR
jgi:hypothetical protein